MIRWNKWTKDYIYTYEFDRGAWVLIHKKSNRPIVHWIKSWYSSIRNRDKAKSYFRKAVRL
jgi:hypothetical protein